MNTKLMLALSIVYGCLVGVLAVLDSGALVVVAMIGGALLAIGWIAVGTTARAGRNRG